jgi:hypothetical protein
MDATYIFLKNKFHALPIIENEMAMGIISFIDCSNFMEVMPFEWIIHRL